jgi:hypothetical protein
VGVKSGGKFVPAAQGINVRPYVLAEWTVETALIC